MRRKGRQAQRRYCGHHNGQHHLKQAQPEHMAAHGAQFGQVELQPDHKHQEHHAKLTQVAHPVRVLGQRQRVGANYHTHDKVAQHGRQFQRPASHHAQHGSQQVQKRELKSGHG